MTLFDKIVEIYKKIIGKAQEPVEKYIKPIFDEAKEKIGSFSIEKPLKQLWNNIVDNYNNFIGKAQEPVEKYIKPIFDEAKEKINSTNEVETPSIKEDSTNEVETPSIKEDSTNKVETPSIKEDSTNNVETPINGIDYAWLEKDRNERWAREDSLRRETQMREDSAYQRAVKDAWASGINPNLMNVQPASSGGGITQAQGLDAGLGSMFQSENLLELEKAIDKEQKEYLLELDKILDQSFEGNENTKDRIKDLISTIIMIFAFKGK